MDIKLKKGMLYVLVASIVNLFFRLFTNFILPKYLSVDSYATIKTYQLYISYASLFALGYIDGMYIEYGGKELSEINKNELVDNLAVCRLFQIIVSILIVVIAVICKSTILLLSGISLLSTNLISYFHNLYQATGKFKDYSKVTGFTSIFTFVINVVLLFLLKEDNANYYIIGYILLNTIIWFILEFKTYKTLGKIKLMYFSWKMFIRNVKNGILLTLGQLSSTILTGLDRWFIKFFMSNLEFAEYSFAVSIEHFLTIAVTPITVTLYNAFCKNREEKYVKKLTETIILFAIFLISVAFGAKFIIENFLQNYMNSCKILFVLFAAQIYYIIIKGIFVNLYKATKQQKKYFIKLVAIIILGVITNWFFYQIYKCKEAFAFGTLTCAIVWFILCLCDFKEYRIKISTYFYLAIETVIFILLGFYCNSIIGFIVYILATVILSKVFLNDSFKYIFRIGIDFCKKKLKINN